MELDKIYNMDCLEGMLQIPDRAIDAIICDLPYGTTANKLDVLIPFDKLWEQYKRITKKGAPIVLFGSEPFSTMLRMSNLAWYRYDWIWEKNRPSNFMQAKNQVLKVHEIISVFGKESPVYYPQGLKPCSKRNSSYSGTSGTNLTNSYDGGKYDQEFENYPTSILRFDVERDGFHPTQKPVDLLRYLIRTYSKEGDTILDNCMGSGTTAVACIKENRHFIGFELNNEYFKKCMQRIDAEQKQLKLF